LRWVVEHLPVLLLVGASGTVRTFETPAVQTLISDLVPPGDRGHATGLYSVGVRVVGVVGTLTGGVIIDLVGPAPVFLAPAVLALIGAAIIGSLPAPASASVGASGVRGIWTDTVSGFRALAALPVVAALIGLTLFVEIFGFAYLSLLPAIAERALEVDAAGLGALSAAAALGGVVGALAVSAAGDASYRGRLLLGVSFGLGAGIAALGTTHAFGLALALCVVIGATSSMFDALQWVLLQASVPDELRGRVIGAWVWAIGFGWAGHLGLGALGDVAGIEAAVVAAGVAVLAVACVATVTAARLRPA
jgi:MFS family permease